MSIESNKIMNLADGKVLYDDLRWRSDHNKDMIAPEFDEATANNAGTYVTHDGGLYYLPDGHTANTTWLNTTKMAVTIGDELSSQNGAINSIITEVPSKNLYDKDSCNPQDGKTYHISTGAITDSSISAISGFIPVNENTKYIFSTGGLAVVKHIAYFSGNAGGIFISRETVDGASFTTPTGCTFIGVAFFNVSHTTEQYNAALAVAQLERGNSATPYEPYGTIKAFSLPASVSDEGKALSPKTVTNGKVAEWQFVETGGGSEVVIDDTLTQSGEAADAKVVGDAFGEITELVHSKNLYNPTDCSPQDGKWYTTSGTVEDAAKYAITGKIPVEASTQYIFSVGGLATIKRVYYFKGDSGETYISNEVVDGAAFTTHSQATYIGLTLFAATHTTEQFNAAIAVAQLEKGNTATSYVPYSVKRMIPTEALEDGTALEGPVNYTTHCSLVNVFDKTIAQDNKYANTSTHEIYDNTDYSFSGFIPVKPNTHYCYSKDKSVTAGSLSSTVFEWDEGKNYIRHGSFDAATTHINQVRTGNTTKFISFNIVYDGDHSTQDFNDVINTIMVVEGCQRPLDYVPYRYEPAIDHLKLDNMYQNNADRFRGKKWLVTGTSVSYQDSKVYTEGVAEGELVRGYIGDISRRKPMIITNEAVSGSTLAGSDANSLINRYQNLNMGSYDFVTIEYGINDFGNNVPVGTASDAAGTTSFAACLKTIIEYVLTQNPICGLIICTDPDVRGATTNQNGNTLKDYADVTLEIAKQYRLPVCDWFYHGGFNPLTRGDGTSRYTLTQSGTHPSVYGHMRMAGMLNQVFDSLLC